MPFVEYREPIRGSMNGLKALRLDDRQALASAELMRMIGLDKIRRYRVFVNKEEGLVGICADARGTYELAGKRTCSLRALRQAMIDMGCKVRPMHLLPIAPTGTESGKAPVIAFDVRPLLPKEKDGAK